LKQAYSDKISSLA
jgi:hypothetical protein